MTRNSTTETASTAATASLVAERTAKLSTSDPETTSYARQPPKDYDRHLDDSVSAYWSRPILSSRRNVAVFWMLLVALCWLRAYVGLSPTFIYAHDAFVMLDGAWRMLHGQRPHVDFSSMIGPAAYIPTLIGLRISGNTATGFGYGQALTALLMGVWAYLLGRRLSDVPRVAYSLCIAVVAVSPTQLGISPFELSPAATYNRYGYALLGLVLLECYRAMSRADLVGGLSTGAVIATLAFLKLPYCLAGIVIVALLSKSARQTTARWAGLVLGFAAVGLAFMAYLGFRASVVWADLALTIAARHIDFVSLYNFNTIFLEGGLLFVLGAAGIEFLKSQDQADEAKALSSMVHVVVYTSLFLILCSYQQGELPLAAFVLVPLVDTMITHIGSAPAEKRALRGISIAGATVFVVVTLVPVVPMMAWDLLVRGIVSHPPTMDTPALRSFTTVGENAGYAPFVNDGLRLLQANLRPGEHVMSLDFSNPFSFGLGIPPAEGGATTIQFQSSFDDQNHVPPERLFGSSELVMLPTVFWDAGLKLSIPRIYGPYLSTHYHLVAESKFWQLYRRLE
jgi:hypothetical protein